MSVLLQQKRKAGIEYLYTLTTVLLAASDLNFLLQIKQQFCKQFKMEDCGEASVCLGLEIRRDRSNKRLHLSHVRDRYLRDAISGHV